MIAALGLTVKPETIKCQPFEATSLGLFRQGDEAGPFLLIVVESDEPLGLAAARIKAGHRLSVADAWIAATADRLGATLVHKDPDFERLAKRIRLKPLPPKSG